MSSKAECGRILLLSIFLSLFSLSSVYGKEGSASLGGQVLDPSGAAIPRASLSLDRSSAQESRQMTDGQGHYEFRCLTPGRYYLRAVAPGFSAELREITVDAGAELTIDFYLSVTTLSEQISVTATRTVGATRDTPVSMSVIDNRQVEQSNVTTIGDLFRQVPGASTVSEGPFRVRPRIRGLDSNRILVLVDGERLNNTRTSTANSGIEIGLVDIDTVERVEVARGSGSVLYGTDALGGTINIITRNVPPAPAAALRLSGGFRSFYSSNETGRRGSINFAGSSRQFSFRVGQTLDRFPAYRSGGSEDSEGRKIVNSGYHGSSTNANVRFYLDGQSLNIGYSQRRAADIGVPGVAGTFNAYFPFSNVDKVRAAWQVENPAPPLSHLRVSGYYQNQERNFTNQLSVPTSRFFPGLFRFSETITDTETVGFDVQTTWVPSARDVLVVGASFFRDRNEDSRFIDRLDPNFRTSPPSLVASQDRSRSVPDATYSDFAVFIQHRYELADWLRLVGGLRVDRFDINSGATAGFDLPVDFTDEQIVDLGVQGLEDGLNVDETSVTGDFGVVVHPREDLSLTTRIGHSFRQPNLFERFFTDFGSVGGFVVGNPKLEPEAGINVDTSVRYNHSRFRATTTFFYNRYRNFLTSRFAFDRNGDPISLLDGTGVSQTVNAARVRTWGLEMEFEAPTQVAGAALILFGNLSYLRGDDLNRDEPLNFITPVKAIAGLRWHDSRNRFWSEYGARIVARQGRLSSAFLDVNDGPEPGFVVHDWRVGLNFPTETYRLGLTFGFLNIGNRLYSEQYTTAPARGRALTAGLNMDF